MKQIIILASLLGGMLFQTKAQEFTIGVNAAQAGMHYKLPTGRTQLRFSYGGELGIQVKLNRHFKILSGLEIFRYVSKATLADNQVYSHNQVDDMGSSFEYRVVTTGYEELQNVTALRIPLLLQLTTGSEEKTQWYFNAGGKFVLPSKITVKASALKLRTTGYYPDVNAEVHDLPQHGFGEVINWQSNGDYSTKAGWLLSAGTGFSFKLSTKRSTRLYTGVYADYGVGNLQSNKTPISLVSYDSKNVSNIKANSSLGIEGVKAMNFIGFGIQVKLSFGRRQPSKQTLAPPPVAKAVKMPEKVEVKETAFLDTVLKKTITEEELAMLNMPVYFGQKNSIDLSPESRQYLTKVAAILNKYPESQLTIKGHTCDLGSPAINEQRSKERAIICADYLINQGVVKERIQIVAVSTAEPVVPNDSEENRQRNRRVTFAFRN